MNLKLSAEQIENNWNLFISNINEFISGDRKDRLLQLYSDLEDIIILAPAATSANNHNCFPGGYIDHINRVVTLSLDVNSLWISAGIKKTYTTEELIFSAINHDLGKVGYPGKPNNLINDNKWEVEKLNKPYKINTANSFTTVPDRTLFLLQLYQIPLSHNEYLAIKLHDGLYDESNKAYLTGYSVDTRLRTSLPHILHQADMMASRVEWEDEWIDKLNKK